MHVRFYWLRTWRRNGHVSADTKATGDFSKPRSTVTASCSIASGYNRSLLSPRLQKWCPLALLHQMFVRTLKKKMYSKNRELRVIQTENVSVSVTHWGQDLVSISLFFLPSPREAMGVPQIRMTHLLCCLMLYWKVYGWKFISSESLEWWDPSYQMHSMDIERIR